MIVEYDGNHLYKISNAGELFWTIFNYTTLSLLYIYPQFFQWFENKVVKGLAIGERLIFASYSNKNKITGYMILKSSINENKICTLQILPQFRRQGYARELLNRAIAILTNPIITVSDSQLDLYSSLLSECGFSLVDTVNDLYNNGVNENIFQLNN